MLLFANVVDGVNDIFGSRYDLELAMSGDATFGREVTELMSIVGIAEGPEIDAIKGTGSLSVVGSGLMRG